MEQQGPAGEAREGAALQGAAVARGAGEEQRSPLGPLFPQPPSGPPQVEVGGSILVWSHTCVDTSPCWSVLVCILPAGNHPCVEASLRGTVAGSSVQMYS